MNKLNYTIQERNKDALLCKAYRTGDETGFVMMCERYDEIIFQPAIALIKDDYTSQGFDIQYIDEEDILQEAKIALMIRMRDPKVYKQIEDGVFKSMVYDSVLKAIYNYLCNMCAFKETTVSDDRFETFYRDPFDIFENESLKKAVNDSLHILNQREFAIFNDRLNGRTYRELASFYNVTIERIHQIDHKAQRKIRRRIMSYNYSMNPNSLFVTHTKRDRLNSTISNMYRSDLSFKEMITPILLPKYIHPECLINVDIKEYQLPTYTGHEHEWNNKEFVESVMKSLNDFTVLVYQKMGLKILSNDSDGVRVILPYTMKFKKSNAKIIDKCNNDILSINEGQTFRNFTCPYDNWFALVRINNSYIPYLDLKSIYF